MRVMKVIRLALAITLGCSMVAFLVGGCGDGGPEDFTAISSAPAPNSVDTGDPGPSLGDYEVFHVTVQKEGKRFGDLYGSKLAVAEPPVEGAPSKDLGLFQNQLTFVLPNGTISIAGVQYFTFDGSIPRYSENAGEYRAIVGGTGAYAGASGELHTTARPDGSRIQEFDFDD